MRGGLVEEIVVLPKAEYRGSRHLRLCRPSSSGMMPRLGSLLVLATSHRRPTSHRRRSSPPRHSRHLSPVMSGRAEGGGNQRRNTWGAAVVAIEIDFRVAWGSISPQYRYRRCKKTKKAQQNRKKTKKAHYPPPPPFWPADPPAAVVLGGTCVAVTK